MCESFCFGSCLSPGLTYTPTPTYLHPTVPKADSQELRSFIGKFGLSGNDAVKPMRFLSGGQKSRAAFALLAYKKPHIVVLDEPTNHLGAVIGGLGGIVLVCVGKGGHAVLTLLVVWEKHNRHGDDPGADRGAEGVQGRPPRRLARPALHPAGAAVL